MTTSARLPSLKSPSSLMLIAALLFMCALRTCPADVLSLQDNACAKKGAGLPKGFSLPKDDQLLMEPLALGSEDINQPIQSQVHALLSNVMEPAETLHFSIIIIEQDKAPNGTCSQFFNAHLRLPNNLNCSFGSEAEVIDDHQQHECVNESAKCMALPVNCSFPMGRTETLPNVRVFTIKMWARIDALNDSHCSWKAIIDGVRVLVSAGDSDELEETCWETNDPICCSSWQINLLICCVCPVVLVLIAALMVACLWRRRQRTTGHTKKKEDKESATEHSVKPTSMAAQFGVEVPESLLSQTEENAKEVETPPDIEAPLMNVVIPAGGRGTVPEPLHEIAVPNNSEEEDEASLYRINEAPKMQAPIANDPIYQTLGNLDMDIFVKPSTTQPPKTQAPIANDPIYQTLGNLDMDIFVKPPTTQPPKTQAPIANDPIYQTLGNSDMDIFVKPSTTQPPKTLDKDIFVNPSTTQPSKTLDKDIFVNPSTTQPPKTLDKDIFVNPSTTQPPKTMDKDISVNPSTTQPPKTLDKDIFVNP